MTSITISDIFTIILVLVDDWYQLEVVKLLRGKPGRLPYPLSSSSLPLFPCGAFMDTI